jgi:hypothetical protein
VKDWGRYIQECFESDLWGFVCLDHYYRVNTDGLRPDPSYFIDEILTQLGAKKVNIVAFHNVLVSLCVQLLGSDFDAIIEKSVSFLRSRINELTSEEVQQIVAHYAVYGKANTIAERISQLRPVEYDSSNRSQPGGKTTMNTSSGMHAREPLLLFYSYAHKDEKMRQKLEEHLKLLEREGVIDGWRDRDITAGADFNDEIDENLRKAKIILLLISAAFINSDYCYSIEMKFALQQHKDKKSTVIPIILRDCDWKTAQFAKLQALPTDGVPVAGRKWKNQDEAFSNIAKGIRSTAQKIRNNP